MAETTSRILALLNLLQTHRQWSGPELAERLDVTERTLRRDIERLRELGYTVDAARGPAGGYRLEAGSQLPPLLLTDDEAVTMAIGLRVAATQGLVDGELTTQSALAKFEQVLPPGLRARVNALASHLQAESPRTATVSQDVLGILALACRDSERLRFHYAAADGTESDRVVEPHALVAAARNWFLVAWDVQRGDWRTFRVDRLSKVFGTRVRFPPREIPGGGAEYVRRSVSSVRARARMDVILGMPIEDARASFGSWGVGVTAIDASTSRWHVEGETNEHLLGALAWIPAGVDYRVEAGPGMLELIQRVAGQLAAAKPQKT